MRGYFGIAIWHPKHEINVGTLMRHAFLYNAAFVGTVGRRYERQASDTPGTANHVPTFNYRDLDDLIAHLPHSCPIVGVELAGNAIPLPRFPHPLRALYLLGAEDHGLPPNILDRCHHVVQIPGGKPWSMNVSVAGSIIMYDRYVKANHAAA